MICLPERLREHRKKLEMTQEEAANALCVAPQTVSKWERGETYPDITMLPALANLFSTTVDELLGMDLLREKQRIGDAYTRARVHLRQRNWNGAVCVYEEALRIWPNDAGLLTDLAMALALAGGQAELVRAAELCERVINTPSNVKVQHTARAALCYVHAKAGDCSKALAAASQLPHLRESREVVMNQLQTQGDWNALLYELSTGENMK